MARRSGKALPLWLLRRDMNRAREVTTLNRRHTWKWLLTAASLAVGVALIASACGSSSNKTDTSGSAGTTSGGTASGGKTFPNFRLAYDTGIDYLDPGLSYTVEGWGIMWNVYLPLVGYKHANGPDGATLVPYLAKDLPKVSTDAKTYTFQVRQTYDDDAEYSLTDGPRLPSGTVCSA